MTKKPIKAVSLISGGLDSLLSTKLIIDQGVHVEGINFFTGFCVEGHTHAIRKQKKDKPKRMIIVLLSTLGAFIFMVFALLLKDRISELRKAE